MIDYERKIYELEEENKELKEIIKLQKEVIKELSRKDDDCK